MIPISYNLRSLAVRKVNTVASVLGIALVVFVLASALMLSQGIQDVMGATGGTDNAIVFRKGSDAELASTIGADNAGLIMAQPGVRQQDGAPVGVAEVVLVASLDKLGSDGISNVAIRGVQIENVQRFRPDVQIVQGKMAAPGTDEVIVGKAIAGRFKGLSVGESFEARKNRPLRVVGVFADGGSSYESEVWGDRNSVQSAFGREGYVSSVRVKLESAASFDAFEAAVEQDKRLGLEAMRETDYNEKQSQMTSILIVVIGVLVTIFFAMGALIGATITMYTSIASRQREVGMLKAIGFPGGSILFSFLLEAFVIAVVGGLLGIALSLLMGFVQFSTMNFATFSEIVFTFRPTPGILVGSMVVAVITGVVGGMYPAVKASRMSPVAAMKRG